MSQRVRRAQRRAQSKQNQAPQPLETRLPLYIGLAGVAVVALLMGLWLFRGPGSDSAFSERHQFDSDSVSAVIYHAGDPTTLYAATANGLMASSDGGENWNETLLADSEIQTAGTSTADHDRIYAGGPNGLVISSDGGSSWEPVSDELPGADIRELAVSASNPEVIYTLELETANLYASQDGGNFWERRTTPPGWQGGGLPLTVSTSNQNQIFAATGDQIHESTDGGTSWNAFAVAKEPVTALAPDPHNENALFIGTDDAVWYLRGNQEWARLDVDPASAVRSIAIAPEQDGQVAILDEDGYLLTADDAFAGMEIVEQDQRIP